MSEHRVATVDEVPEGERLVIELEGREIGVFNHEGEYFAYLNWCAHQSGPVCQGNLSGTIESDYDPGTRAVERRWVKEGEILNCPWHGWEYDLTSGECLSKRGVTLPSYPVTVEDGHIVVSL